MKKTHLFLYSILLLLISIPILADDDNLNIERIRKICKGKIAEITIEKPDDGDRDFTHYFLNSNNDCLFIITKDPALIKLTADTINKNGLPDGRIFYLENKQKSSLKSEGTSPLLSSQAQCESPGVLSSMYNNLCSIVSWGRENPGKAIAACGLTALAGYALYNSEEARKGAAAMISGGFALPYLAHSSEHIVKFFPSLRNSKTANGVSAILNLTNALYNYDLKSLLSAISSTINMIGDKKTRDKAFFMNSLAMLGLNSYLNYQTKSPKYLMDAFISLMLTAPELQTTSNEDIHSNETMKKVAGIAKMLMASKDYYNSNKIEDLTTIVGEAFKVLGKQKFYGYDVPSALALLKESNKTYSDIQGHLTRERLKALPDEEKYLTYPFTKDVKDEKHLILGAKDSSRPFFYRGIGMDKDRILSERGVGYKSGVQYGETGLSAFAPTHWRDDKSVLGNDGPEFMIKGGIPIESGQFNVENQQVAYTIGPWKPFTDRLNVAENFACGDDGLVVMVDGDSLKERTVNMNENFGNYHRDQHEFTALGGVGGDDVILIMKFSSGYTEDGPQRGDLLELGVNPTWMERSLMGDPEATRKIKEAKDLVLNSAIPEMHRKLQKHGCRK